MKISKYQTEIPVSSKIGVIFQLSSCILLQCAYFKKLAGVFGGFLVNQLYREIEIERPDIELNPKS